MDYNPDQEINVSSAGKLARLIKNNTCVIIKISASWCGPCKNQEFLKNYYKLKTFYKDYQNVKFIELDVDSNSDILDNKKYYDIEVNSVPTFLVSINGSFVHKLEGTNYLTYINQVVNEALQKNF